MNVINTIFPERRRGGKLHLSLNGKASHSYLQLSFYLTRKILSHGIYTWIRTEFFLVSHFSKRNTKAKCHSNWIFLFIPFSDWCQYGKPSDSSFFVTVLGLNEVEDKPDTGRILKMVISPTVLSKNCLWINLYASHIVHYRKIICFLMLMLKLTMVFIKVGHHSELFLVSSYCRSSCLEIILCLRFSRKSIWKNII